MCQNGNLPQNRGESQKSSQWLVSSDPLEVQVQPTMFNRLVVTSFIMFYHLRFIISKRVGWLMVDWMVINFPMTDLWDDGIFTYTHEWLEFDGKLAGNYISPMDPMGNRFLFSKIFLECCCVYRNILRGKKRAKIVCKF